MDAEQSTRLHASFSREAMEAGRRRPKGTPERGGENRVAGCNTWCWHVQLSGTPCLVRQHPRSGPLARGLEGGGDERRSSKPGRGGWHCEKLPTTGRSSTATRRIERATPTRFSFATPHHAWERRTSENTNWLLRQYLPERRSMAPLTQHDCESHCGAAQPPAPEAARLSHPGGMLCPMTLSVALQS